MTQKVFTVRWNPVRCDLPYTPIDRANIYPRTKQGFMTFAIAACWMIMLVAASAEQSVTLAWDRSTDLTAIGYRVYTQEENAAAATSINVGGLTQVTLPGLKEGLRYTFTVTSYNAAGVESVPSSEARFVVPVPLRLLPGTTIAAAKRLQFPMAPGHWYELQASSDLKTWVTIWQTGTASSYAWTEFQDPLSVITINDHRETGFRSRFYRLRIR